jgi:hypothetical protein
MKSLWFYITCLLLSVITSPDSYSQHTPAAYNNQLKISHFKLVDPVNPGIEVSYERLYLKHFSTQLTCTLITDLLYDPGYGAYASNPKGWQLGLEQKYFTPGKGSSKSYFSVEVNHLEISYTTEDEFGYKPATADTILYIYLETFDLHRRTTSFNLRAGQQFYYRHFVFDIAVGLGLKYRDVTHTGRRFSTDKMIMPTDLNAYYLAEKEGAYLTLSVPYTFKIGYRF